MNYDQWKLMTDRDEMNYAEDGLCGKEVTAWLKEQGATLIDVMEGETTCDINFDFNGAWFNVEDLSLEDFEDMSDINDMIAIYDDTGTSCCGASYDSDHRRCHHCQEAF